MLLVRITTDDDAAYYFSEEGAAFEHWWAPKIISFSAPTYSISNTYGGYVQMGFGSMSMSPDSFGDGVWPPPITADIEVYSAESSEVDKICLFAGMIRLKQHTVDELTYDLYGNKYETKCLTELTAGGYDEADVTLPMAIGEVKFVQPVRLPDRNDHQCYDLGHIQGTVHTDWHVYDDGVDVCSNVTGVSDNTFEYTVVPVGTLTISGTGNLLSLSDVCDWGAGELGLAFNGDLAGSPTPINTWIEQQTTIMELINALAGYHAHIVYILDGTLYLIDMLHDNGVRQITEWDLVSVSYSLPAPISKLTSDYTVSQAGTWRESGGTGAAAVYVKTETKTVDVVVGDPGGSEMKIDSYSGDMEFSIYSALQKILSIMQRPQITIRATNIDMLPVPGENLYWAAESFYQPLQMWLAVRSVQYDFDNYELIISGDGSVSA